MLNGKIAHIFQEPNIIRHFTNEIIFSKYKVGQVFHFGNALWNLS